VFLSWTWPGFGALYWRDRNTRFHLSDRLAPSPRVDDRLREIEQDPTAIFWDSVRLDREVAVGPYSRAGLLRRVKAGVTGALRLKPLT
jgi:hypothetical protein